MKKLFIHAPATTEIALVLTTKGHLETRLTPGLPLPLWPDGRWCTEVASYLGGLAAGNVSLTDRGGTLGTYMSQLSPLIRYCWRTNTKFSEMGDNSFAEFINEIVAEKTFKKGVYYARRNGRTVCTIGRRCLDFLTYIGTLHGISNLVAVDGHISVSYKSASFKTKSGKPQTVRYVSHRSFPPVSPATSRQMISQTSIDQLRSAAILLTSNSFLQRRRLVLLRLLEALGARRLEIARVRVADIVDAAQLAKPELRVYNAKRRNRYSDESVRTVAIGHHELSFVLDYIRFFRSPIVAKTLGISNDHGFLLISFKSGQPLTPSTLTLELSKMRVHAGVTGKAHPHLFRNRFITMSLLRLIKASGITNRTELDAMLKIESFKEQVAQETGHKDPDSLNIYIDAAFIELNGAPVGKAQLIEASKLASSLKSATSELKELAVTLSKEELLSEVVARFTGIASDLNNLIIRED